MASEIKVDTISEKTSANGVTIDGVSLKDSKIATANSVDSDAYVDASIDNAHLADNAVDTAEIADNAVTLAKMAGLARGKLIYGDASGDPAALAVGGADEVLTHDGTDLAWAAASGFDVSSITGATALEEQPALTDELVLSDAGVLKRLDVSHMSNTPMGHFQIGGNQTISTSTDTKLAITTAVVDVGGTFDGVTNYRWTPGVAGYYYVYFQTHVVATTDADYVGGRIKKNQIEIIGTPYVQRYYNSGYGALVTVMDDNDYLELYMYQTSGGDLSIGTGLETFFGGFRLTGLLGTE